MLLLLLNTITTRIYNKLSSSCTVFKVLYDFIMCPEMGPYSRVHRDYKYTSEYAILNKNNRQESDVKSKLA